MQFLKVFYFVVVSFIASASLQACSIIFDTFVIEKTVISFLNGDTPGAAYMTIQQTASKNDSLLSVRLDNKYKETAPKARVELHDHIAESINGQEVKKMVALQEVEIPSSVDKKAGVIEFKKGGKHLMLYNFPDSLKNSEKITLVLTFKNAGEVAVNFKVLKPGKEKAENNCGCPA